MNQRILIVEDDPSALRLIEFALQQERYEVTTATNGLTGLKKAQNEKPDLVILDLMLPGLDGFEICSRLRQEPETAQTPILILSAKTHESDISTARDVGADAYLTKSGDPSEIVAQVQTLLSQKPLIM